MSSGTVFYEAVDTPVSVPFKSASTARIISHSLDEITITIDIWVEWRESLTSPRRASKFREIDVQSNMPDILYAYWSNLGGRDEATKVSMYHVFDITDESPSKYLVQWIGYGEDEATWEPKGKVELICPRAVMKWKAWKAWKKEKTTGSF